MSVPGADGLIDPDTFEQILEMDDPGTEREFSKSIVYDFFAQAETTFTKMDKSLNSSEEGSMNRLSELGHFLKGSSATLGLLKVKDSCEKIQNYGKMKDETGLLDVSEQESRERLAETIKLAKNDFEEVKAILRKFYREEDSASL